MKTKLTILTAVLSLSATQAATFLIDGPTGSAIDNGETVSWTVTGDGLHNANGDVSLRGDGAFVTITFDKAVTFNLAEALTVGAQQFNGGASATTDGTWVLTAGTAPFDVIATASGGDLTFADSWSGANDTRPVSTDDWGAATAAGITTFTLINGNASANEAYNISFDFVGVPEPSSTALLGLGGLALLARRRR